MLASIFKVLANGLLVIVGIKIFYTIFGGYIGFLFYHINLAIFLLFQGLLHGETMILLSLAAIIGLFVFVFKKAKSIFSF